MLVILDGILAIAGIYLGLGVFAGRIFPILILAVAFGVLAAVVGMIRAALRATRRATSRVVAQRLDPRPSANRRQRHDRRSHYRRR